MLAKSVYAYALLAISAGFVSATPPACLLGAVNMEPNPADLASICGHRASAVSSQIRKGCAGNAPAAMSAFKSTCASAGYHVVTHSKPKHTSSSKTHSHSKIHSKTHSKVHVTTKTKKEHKPTKTSSHSQHPHKTTSKLTHTHTHDSSKSKLKHHSPTRVKAANPTDPREVPTAAISSQGNAASTSAPPPAGNNAGRIDAEGFAALALMAAGLTIFL